MRKKSFHSDKLYYSLYSNRSTSDMFFGLLLRWTYCSLCSLEVSGVAGILVRSMVVVVFLRDRIAHRKRYLQ